MGTMKEIKFNGCSLLEFKPDYIIGGFFGIKPYESYKEPKNFPNCCDFHKTIYLSGIEYFNLLPNCCKEHEEIFKQLKVNKSLFVELPQKIVNQLSYTTQYIEEKINSIDWYNDITEYIEYNIESFGQPAMGLHIYIDNLIFWLNESETELSKSKIIELLNYIDSLKQPSNNKKTESKTDLNLLVSIYNDWLSLFPFELSYFENIKFEFQNKLRILTGEERYNRHSGKIFAAIHTKSSLLKSLIETTIILLTEINGLKLHEKGLITDSDKTKYELIIKDRELKLKAIKLNETDKKQAYIKILKQWFKDEKEFMNDIKPFLKPIYDTDSKKTQYKALYYAYLFESKHLIIDRTKGKVEHLEEIGKIENVSPHNFRQTFNKYEKKSNRINVNNKNIIELIIKDLNKYPDAKKIAESEIKEIKKNM